MTLTVWIKASRLPSQSYILFPLLYGQGLSLILNHAINWPIFILTHLYGLFVQLFIVYANDYADVEVDRDNKTFNMFSGGSRMLVEGLITKRQMLAAILLTMIANGAIGLCLAIIYHRPFFLALLAISWLLLWMYSFGPLKLSYRGGGELLQMIGVGIVLPLIGFYNQTGSLTAFPWAFMIFLVPIQIGAAMATSIPDEPSDRKGNKRTSSVLLGPTIVKVIISVLYGTSFFLFALYKMPGWPLTVKAGILGLPVILLLLGLAAISHSPAGSARSNNYVAIMVASVVFFMMGLGIKCFAW